MLAVCPNCRHSFLNGYQTACPPCFKEKMCDTKISKINLPANCSLEAKCTMNFNTANEMSVSKPKQRIRKLASGGTVIYNEASSDKNREKSCNHKISKNGPLPPSESFSLVLPGSLFSSCHSFSIRDEKLKNSFLKTEEDVHRIATSQKYLKLSGWYHQKLTWKSAIGLLMPTPVGTFLVRDSSDCKYLYSLSIQTKCGPSSIRIHYSNGEFRLDADHSVAKFMPTFPCLIKLIQSYIELTQRLPMKCKLGDENQNLINCFGTLISQIVISKPLYTKEYFPSLKHLSRLCINRNLVDPNFITVLPAPSFVINYLQEYPHKY